ncbi:MAG TPA: GDSL-type esterase/lipase family protein, partial [Planctomycetota bacterium]|nr:GDSL-type esterase/lipase family protein [Planctomycetota bacterium]
MGAELPRAGAPPGSAPPARRTSRGRRLRACGLTLVGCLLIVLVGFELGARLLVPDPFQAEADLVGMYQDGEEPGSVRTVPGWEGEFTIEGRTLPIRLNSLGLRGPEPGPPRPGELRVLCLGDSFVFGHGVTAEEAFPHVLQERLAARLGRPVTAGNAGVPGYGTVEQLHCLRRIGPAFGPSIVVCTLYLGNDFVDDRVLNKHVEGGYSVTGQWAALMRRSPRARLAFHSRAWLRLELLLLEAGWPWALQPGASPEEQEAFAGFPRRADPNQCMAGLFMDVIDPARSWDEQRPAPVVPRVLARTADSLRAIVAEAGAARVLVVVLPSWWHVVNGDRLAVMQEVGLDPAEYRAGLA